MKRSPPARKRRRAFPEGFQRVRSGLAVEVLSFQDSLKEVGQKIGEFLENGIPAVWLVDPTQKTITVYRSLSQTQQFTTDEVITAEPIGMF